MADGPLFGLFGYGIDALPGRVAAACNGGNGADGGNGGNASPDASLGIYRVFDRVIVAQALRRNLTVATRDAKILTAALVPTPQA
ncbi:MAG: hypothetical protein M3N26_11800 [Pseudomonadota bacterium]|nr:hypothetical protein [Pseudomonadota bacterium]